MHEADWDIQEAKRLKKKLLVQTNLAMLLIFVLSIYYIATGGSASVWLGLLCLLLWIVVAHVLYTLITGKTIGTKTSRLVLAFDKDHQGEKRWKRRKLIEAIVIIPLSMICTILWFGMDTSSMQLAFHNAFPFLGAWLGFNIGEAVRIKNL